MFIYYRALTVDVAVLARADEIGALHEQRITVRKEQGDLPRRRRDLERLREQLKEQARDLDWGDADIDGVLGRIPQHAEITATRTLWSQRGALQAAVDSTTVNRLAAEDALKEARAQLQKVVPIGDVSALAEAVTAMQPMQDVETRVAAAQEAWLAAQVAVAARLTELQPAVLDAEQLEGLVLPSEPVARGLRDALRTAAARVQRLDEQIAGKQQELQAAEAGLERRVRAEGIVMPEALRTARDHRGRGWALIRARYIDAQKVEDADIAAFCGADATLAVAFENTVQRADELADQRFDRASAAGQVAEQQRHTGELRVTLEVLRAERTQAEAGLRKEEARWREAWGPQPFELRDPDAMLAWLEQRKDLLDALGAQRTAKRRLESLQAEASATRRTLMEELVRVLPDPAGFEGKPIRVLMEHAAGICRKQEQLEHERDTLATAVRNRDHEARRCCDAAEVAKKKWEAWRTAWAAQLERLGVATGLADEAAEARLETLEAVRATARDVRMFERDRIQAMENDIEAFAAAVREFLTRTNMAVTATDPAEVVLELEQRVDAAEQVVARRAEVKRNLADLEERARAEQASRAKAQAVIDELQRTASVGTLADLQAAVQRDSERRQLLREQRELQATVLADGDGHTLDELRAECVATDLDAATQRQAQLEPRLEELQSSLQQAALARQDTRRAVDAIGTGDEAALAAGEREEALSALRAIAATYVRARAASTILGWTVERYQREKQGPLLQQAGVIFATLTLQSFAGLRTEYDDEDRAQLVGVRPDATTVAVSGMSDGTADQLYLALRLAAVHEHLEHAPPVPFIADDLFVNFDDQRATAGFKVLADLAQRTQVLFFTHHRHLVELAQATMGPNLDVGTLSRADG